MTARNLSLSVLGFFVLPARRQRARAAQRVREAIAPHTRFVRSEEAQLHEAETALARIGAAVAALAARVEAIGQSPGRGLV